MEIVLRVRRWINRKQFYRIKHWLDGETEDLSEYVVEPNQNSRGENGE